jgi:hypothetical protein
MYQVIEGKLHCDGDPVGVRREVVQAVLADWGYEGDTTMVLARGAAEEMLRMERELLLKGVEITVRRVNDSAA